MAEKATQHFVPQYFFRLFNGRKKFIHLVPKNSSKIIYEASVRKQCARHRYYGSTEFEDFLGTYDSIHGLSLNVLAENSRKHDNFELSDEILTHLLEFLMLQRSRVPRAATKFAEMDRQMTLSFLREILLTSTSIPARYELIQAIDNNTIVYDQDPLKFIMQSMKTSLPRWRLISDLNWLVIRNLTEIPFVFGDSPVVFYNQYLHQYHEDTGTIGLMSPGLMISLPTGADLSLILYDHSVYSVSSSNRVIDIVDKPIVSRLNALQVLSAVQNVFFGDDKDGEYVHQLVNAHRSSFTEDFTVVRIMPPGSFLVDGAPSENEIMHTFERQLPIGLNLPFMHVQSLPPLNEIPHFRNEKLANSLRSVDDRFNTGSLSAENFLKEILPQVRLPTG